METAPERAPHAARRVLYADGGTVGGSPGKGIYWSVAPVEGPAVRVEECSAKQRWSCQAEFQALIAALRRLMRDARGGDVAIVRMDAQAVIHAVTRGRPPRNHRLDWLFREADRLMKRLRGQGVRIFLEWVPREEVEQVVGH